MAKSLKQEHPAAPDVNEYRVLGPPGCGKTWWLEHRVADEIRERGSGERMLITSLTKAAAQVVVRRGLEVPKDHVGTLHAHCYRALGGGPIAETKLTEFSAEHPRYKLTGDRGSVEDAAAQDESVRSTAGDKLFAQMAYFRSVMRPPEQWPPTVRDFAAAWSKWKADHGYRDFTDLIELCYQSVSIAPHDPAVIFVDEAQDHDQLELALLRKWGRYAERLYMVGDPDQSIYEWRGANPDLFHRPGEASAETLKQSYRVPLTVRDAANRWIRQVRNRETVDYSPKLNKDTKAIEQGKTRRLSASYRQPFELLRDIERQLKTPGRTLMIIGASGFMVERVVSALRREGIPFSNHYRKKQKRWNPLESTKGNSPFDRITAFMRPLAGTWGGQGRIWSHPEIMRFMEPLGVSVLKPGAKTAIKSYSEGGPVSVRLLQEYFQPEALERMIHCDLDWYLSAVVPHRRESFRFPSKVMKTRGPAGLELAPRLTVGTIHSVKGGEADVVYVLPDLAPSAFADWTAGGRKKDALIRMFYVAMTRAADELVILAPSSHYRASALI